MDVLCCAWHARGLGDLVSAADDADLAFSGSGYGLGGDTDEVHGGNLLLESAALAESVTVLEVPVFDVIVGNGILEHVVVKAGAAPTHTHDMVGVAFKCAHHRALCRVRDFYEFVS